MAVESVSRIFQAGRETRLKNATDKKPSIGEDDYKADLDSVNLIGRMQRGNPMTKPYLPIMLTFKRIRLLEKENS